MMAKPMKTLELHFPMIQFLINTVNSYFLQSNLYSEGICLQILFLLFKC